MFAYLNDREPLLEVPLPAAPLLRALVQVQYPPVQALFNPGLAQDLIAKVQAALTEEYPLFEVEREVQLAVPAPDLGPPTLRLRTVDGVWEAAFHPLFVALSTSVYTSRADLLGRLAAALDVAHNVLGVRAYQRLGVRYVNQVTPDFGDVTTLLQPDVAGSFAPVSAHFVVEADIRDLLLDVEGDKLHVRYGHVPAGDAVLLGVDPCPSPSWVLDLDAYTQTPTPFVTADILGETERLAEKCYRVFRGTVTDQFLERAGGRP